MLRKLLLKLYARRQRQLYRKYTVAEVRLINEVARQIAPWSSFRRMVVLASMSKPSRHR